MIRTLLLLTALLFCGPVHAEPVSLRIDAPLIATWENPPRRHVVDVVAEGNHKQLDDISETLQRAIANQYQHQCDVYVRAGNYVISKTITIPNREGSCCYGVGSGQKVSTAPLERGRLVGYKTTLLWKGPPDQPMFRVLGSQSEFGGFLLYGKSGIVEGVNDCDALIQIEHVGGIGSGHHHFEDIYLEGSNVGIRNGTTGSMHACEHNYYHQITFGKDLRIGFECRNSQGVGHYFYKTRSGAGGGAKVYFEFSAGGDLHAVDTLCQSTLLRLRQNDEAKKFSPSYQTGGYRFTVVRNDFVGGENVKWLQVDDALAVDIVMEGVRYSNRDDKGTLAELAPGVSLTLRDCQGLYSGCFGREDDPRPGGRILLDNCCLFGERDVNNLTKPNSRVQLVDVGNNYSGSTPRLRGF